jgi:hypothetical protein
MTHNFEKLYYYDCLEDYRHVRSGYTWNSTIQNVKNDIKSNYINPSRIHVRLVKVLSEEYTIQLKKKKAAEG